MVVGQATDRCEHIYERREYLRKLLMMVVVLALGVACAPSLAPVQLLPDQKARAPVPSHRVAVYKTLAEVQGKYEEIALIKVKGNSMWTGKGSMMESVKAKAGELGANGIVLDVSKDIGVLGKVATSYWTLGLVGKKSIQVLAIFVLPKD